MWRFGKSYKQCWADKGHYFLMINWQYYQKFDAVPLIASKVISVFDAVSAEIDSTNHNLTSNSVFAAPAMRWYAAPGAAKSCTLRNAVRCIRVGSPRLSGLFKVRAAVALVYAPREFWALPCSGRCVDLLRG